MSIQIFYLLDGIIAQINVFQVQGVDFFEREELNKIVADVDEINKFWEVIWRVCQLARSALDCFFGGIQKYKISQNGVLI